MIEVPDEEDNTAYQRWLAKGGPIASPKQCMTALLTPPESLTPIIRPLPNKEVALDDIRKIEVILPTVATPSAASAKAQEVLHR